MSGLTEQSVTQSPDSLPWVRTKDRLPTKPNKASYEHVTCMIFYKGSAISRQWNCEHNCWDDEEGDDFFCNAFEPTHWFEITPPAIGS